MDSRRAETLEALSAYIQTQKSLFSRAEADIERLRKLREDALIQPKIFTDNIGSKLNSPGLRLSEQQAPPLSNELHWQVFSSCDPTPLRTFAVQTRLTHTERSVPHTIQHSPLSTLQQFVKDARRTIIDPVLENLDPDNTFYLMSNSNITASPFHTGLDQPALSENEDADEDKEMKSPPVQESFAAARRRERAHAKIQKLKERKIRSEALTEAEESADAVFVRHDVDDESGEVDISESSLWPPSAKDSASMDVDDSADTTVPSTPSTLEPSELAQPLASWSGRCASTISRRQSFITQSESLIRSSRTRKPSLKLQNQSFDISMEDSGVLTPTSIPLSTLGKRSRDPPIVMDSSRKIKPEAPSIPEPKADADKARSETYKQAWSVSEQHLLERLLEEIPDGERNRWAKISQAMGGSRTPRQVASRVQKYFEKLKRFGVGVEKKSKGSSRS
ncbi:hypothetical protein K503DRAFT_866549 [Rhizopogon vinicolor AM-OR11-026]|uniref:Uncharacterized protein n=1 Tax=Rhizopogon vinicolor AM-OR11-026 TaxID=1314800 RepID=A0A1B7MZ61_9AGAM|nr:hypothetical protein K503DRAFT_866549 [Rhizopogon vinicolor AM-OR11-026]